MKLVIGSVVTAVVVLISACGNENVNSMEDSNISAAAVSSTLSGQMICSKSMPPQCSVDGKPVETSPTGVPKKDAAGNYIFKE